MSKGWASSKIRTLHLTLIRDRADLSLIHRYCEPLGSISPFTQEIARSPGLPRSLTVALQ